jgi:hypothetical protein
MKEQTDNIVEPLLWLSIFINVNNVMVIVFGGLFFGEIWKQIKTNDSSNRTVTLFINIGSLLLVVVPFVLALYAVISSNPDVLNIAYSVGVIICSIIARCVVGYNKNKADNNKADNNKTDNNKADNNNTDNNKISSVGGGRRRKLRRIGR